MKELDIVRLTCAFENIPKGTEGCIVLEYDGLAYEVEYFDNNGDTIGVLTTPTEFLELVKTFNN